MRVPWTTKRDLRDEIESLNAQIERMDKVNAAVSLLRAGAQPDKSFMLELHSDLWPLIAQSLFVWFKETGGVNYIEQRVMFVKEETDKQRASLTFTPVDSHLRSEPFTLTLQRQLGKTPHELRIEAERKLAAAEAAIAELRASIEAPSVGVSRPEGDHTR